MCQCFSHFLGFCIILSWPNKPPTASQRHLFYVPIHPAHKLSYGRVLVTQIDECLTIETLMIFITNTYLYSRSPRSARAELLENPPKLSEDVLRQLLEDARSSVASTPATDFTDNQSPDSYPLSPDRK